MNGIINSGGRVDLGLEKGISLTVLEGRGERMGIEQKKLDKLKVFLLHGFCFLFECCRVVFKLELEESMKGCGELLGFWIEGWTKGK